MSESCTGRSRAQIGVVYRTDFRIRWQMIKFAIVDVRANVICDYRGTTPSCREGRWRTARRSKRTSTSGLLSSRSTQRVICLVSLFYSRVTDFFLLIFFSFLTRLLQLHFERSPLLPSTLETA